MLSHSTCPSWDCLRYALYGPPNSVGYCSRTPRPGARSWRSAAFLLRCRLVIIVKLARGKRVCGEWLPFHLARFARPAIHGQKRFQTDKAYYRSHSPAAVAGSLLGFAGSRLLWTRHDEVCVKEGGREGGGGSMLELRRWFGFYHGAVRSRTRSDQRRGSAPELYGFLDLSPSAKLTPSS